MIVAAAYKTTKELLVTNRALLEAAKDYLIKEETIDTVQLQQLIDDHAVTKPTKSIVFDRS